MVKKLEKRCSTINLNIGERYCLCAVPFTPNYIFLVEGRDFDSLSIRFLDGTAGFIPLRHNFDVFEFPFSSLEKELL